MYICLYVDHCSVLYIGGYRDRPIIHVYINHVHIHVTHLNTRKTKTETQINPFYISHRHIMPCLHTDAKVQKLTYILYMKTYHPCGFVCNAQKKKVVRGT